VLVARSGQTTAEKGRTSLRKGKDPSRMGLRDASRFLTCVRNQACGVRGPGNSRARVCSFIMNLSQQAYELCGSAEGDNHEELAELFRVDVDQYRSADGSTAIHEATSKGKVGCMQVLMGLGADLEARDENGDTPVILASSKGHLECLRVLIEARADVHARSNDGDQAIYFASLFGKARCLKLLIHEGADVNAQSNHGSTPAMGACQDDQLTCLQLLLDANADISTLENTGADALNWAIRMPMDSTTHRVPGMPFSVLSCNTNATGIVIGAAVTQAMVDGHITEYKAVHAFIDEHQSILKHALSRDVQVDRRVGLGEHGIYQEPLERVLEYMGLSMDIDQVVNESIDDDGKRHALLPGNVLEANHWYEQYIWAVNRAAIARELALKMEEQRLAFEAKRQARKADGGY
jgi:hypothetical protein